MDPLSFVWSAMQDYVSARMDREVDGVIRPNNAGLIARARNRLASSQQRLAMSEALLRHLLRLLPAVPPTSVLRSGPPIEGQARELQAGREVSRSLLSSAEEIRLEVRETCWHAQQTRAQASLQRARAAHLRTRLSYGARSRTVAMPTS